MDPVDGLVCNSTWGVYCAPDTVLGSMGRGGVRPQLPSGSSLSHGGDMAASL